MTYMMKRGFTLIELLVVVAIIAVLIAVLMPSLASAREQARGVKCLSTLRQYGLAAQTYADQSADYYASARTSAGVLWFANDLYRGGLNLTGTSAAYSRNFICPCATYALDHPSIYLGGQPYFSLKYSYGINVEGLDLTLPDVPCFKRSTIENPSAKIQFADAMDWWMVWTWSAAYVGESPLADASMLMAYRHADASNIVYFDGHAERTPRRVASKLLNPNARYQLWRPISAN